MKEFLHNLKRNYLCARLTILILYMNNKKTNILIGNKRHWRTVDRSLCTFMTSKVMIDKYWNNFYNTCLDRNEPFEKYLNEIYQKGILYFAFKKFICTYDKY